MKQKIAVSVAHLTLACVSFLVLGGDGRRANYFLLPTPSNKKKKRDTKNGGRGRSTVMENNLCAFDEGTIGENCSEQRSIPVDRLGQVITVCGFQFEYSLDMERKSLR